MDGPVTQLGGAYRARLRGSLGETESRRGRIDLRMAALAAAIAVVWGLCFVLIQASLPTPAPLLMAGVRALIGGAVLAAAVLVRGAARSMRGRGDPGPARAGGGPPSMERRTGLPRPGVALLLGLLNATVAFGAMYLAAGRAEAATASVLASGQPLALAAAGWLRFGERGSRLTVAGLALGLAGVVLLATATSGPTTPDGAALALLASAAPTAGTLLMRGLWNRVDLLATTGLQFLLGGVILVAVSAMLEPWSEVPWSPALLPGLLVLGVLGTGLAYVAWFWLLGRLSLVVLGSALFLVPVIGLAVAIAVGDRPSPAELIGMAAAVTGIGLVAADSATLRRPPAAGKTT